MRDQLMSMSKEQVLEVFRDLNSGKVGFDHERVRKGQCIALLCGSGVELENGTSIQPFGFTEDMVKAAIERVMGTRPAAQPSATPVAAADQQQIANQIAGLFATLAGSAVNEDKVRQIVAGEVAAALERSPVVRIEIGLPDGSTRTPKGHVRDGFADIMRDASVGLNILLVGPAGSGKTHLGHQVAESLGREFASVSCTTGMSESVLSGWLLPSEGGAFEYVESDFVRLYENGGVFLFDEVDAADPNTLLFINQALANGSFFVPQRKGRSKVTRHEDFVCIAAANTWGNGANGTYAGRERLDEAFLDRFRAGRHFVDYDKRFERSAVSPDLLAWGWAVRKRMNELRMQRVLSTRFLLDATRSMTAGKTVEAVKETFFLDWKKEDRQKVDV